MKISVVVNTYNEEKNLSRCLESVKDFADEIVLVDMHSTDKTVEIAEKYQAKVFFHEYTRYVEPARNFALRQARGDWIFLIDADEELSKSLAAKLSEVAKENKLDYVEIPRKNIIFNKWIEHSRWWPDYVIRFFRKGKIKFSDKIHVPPTKEGQGIKLEAGEKNALVHYNFHSIAQFIERLNRYSDIQSEEFYKSGYYFEWQDLLIKPASEFFSRFFAGEGYKDGIHGLTLSLLQAFSELVVYLKVWGKEGFKEEKIDNFDNISQKIIKDFSFWQGKISSGFFGKIRLKIKSKI